MNLQSLSPKRKKILAACLILLFLLLFALKIMQMTSKNDTSERPEPARVLQSVPDAELSTQVTSKTESYRNSTRTNQYWEDLSEEWDEIAKERGSIDRSSTKSSKHDSAPPQISVSDILSDSNESVQKKSSSSSSAATQKKSSQRSQEYENTNHTQEITASSDAAGSITAPQDFTTIGESFTLTGHEEKGKTYRCMFTRNEKVKDGQRISIRILDEMTIQGFVIPRNTHIMASVSLSQRMNIHIAAIDVGGRILSLDYDAYDTDGMKGIYVSELSKAVSEASSQGISTTQSLLGGRLGRVASDVATLGLSIARSRSGEVCVDVPSGYHFYIMQNEK